MTEEDVAAGYRLELWPDVSPAASVFSRITTQWRAGPSGIYGLDYSVLPFMFRMCEIRKSDWPDLLDDIREMEDAVLSKINEK